MPGSNGISSALPHAESAKPTSVPEAAAVASQAMPAVQSPAVPRPAQAQASKKPIPQTHENRTNSGKQKPAAQQTQPSPPTADGKPAAKPFQVEASPDVVDITADDTDSSQAVIEAAPHSHVAPAPSAARAADVAMAEANQNGSAVPSADAAEAFISLELEEAASKSVSPTHAQTDVAAPAVAAKDDMGKQLVGLGNPLITGNLLPSAPFGRPSSTSVSANGRPASANARMADNVSDALQPEQKMLPGPRAKAAGKGGIQIVMATKHKEAIIHS